MYWFPDVYDGDVQEELKAQRIPVWGSGKTEWLERDRFRTTEWMQSVGLPTPKERKLLALTNLENFQRAGILNLMNLEMTQRLLRS